MSGAWVALMLVLAAATGDSEAARTAATARAREVLAREWSAVQPPAWAAGRPAVRVLPGDEVCAEVRRLGPAGKEPFATEITLSAGLLQTLVGDDDGALAAVIGHELAHLVLGHHRAGSGGRQDDVVIGWGASREAEFAADELATRLAGGGGYDPQGLVRVLERARERLGKGSYFDSLGGEHPDLAERLAALEQDRAALWEAALDFEIGVDLLGGEDFASAEACFRSAREQFPEAPEVLCNLGCCLLMLTYRALPPEHWVRFDLGQPLEPGYATFLPVEPRRTRAEAELARLRALWTEAVGYLQAALRHSPRYALALGNLGFAYLVAPDGPRTAEAQRWLEAAANGAGGEDGGGGSGGSGLRRALANDRALVARLGGDREGARSLLEPLAAADGKGAGSTAPGVNLCLLLAESPSPADQTRAADRLEQLLPRTPAPSAQWEYAHGKYLALCARLQRTPLPEAGLSPAPPRTVAAQVVCGAARLYLGSSLAGVVKALGAPEVVVPLGREGALSCWRYPSAGLELVFARDRLVRAKLRPGGTARLALLRDGAAAGALSAGDPAASLDRLLPPFDATVRLGDGKPYRYYARARLAALVEDGRIASLALVGARP